MKRAPQAGLLNGAVWWAGVVLVMAMAGCDDGNGASSVNSSYAGNAAEGKRLVSHYGCTACHVVPGVTGASLGTGLPGPSLEGLSSRSRLAGGVENTVENLVKWILDPQAVKPGTAMPQVSATEREARDMAAYLREAQ